MPASVLLMTKNGSNSLDPRAEHLLAKCDIPYEGLYAWRNFDKRGKSASISVAAKKLTRQQMVDKVRQAFGDGVRVVSHITPNRWWEHDSITIYVLADETNGLHIRYIEEFYGIDGVESV